MKHTPGPWKISDDQTQDYQEVIVQDNGDGKDVACAYHEDAIEPSAEETANARLIAAAPDLLETLESVLPDLEHYASTHGPAPDCRLEAVKAALEKAKGED